MAVLIDTNQIMISCASVYHKYVSPEIDVSGIRNLFFNEILSLRKKFGDDYGEMIFAFDHRVRWRTDFFPYYKDNRAKTRAKSPMDWESIFAALDAIREEIDKYTPWPAIYVKGAEGDDVIAVLARHFYDNPPTTDSEGNALLIGGEPESVVIVSEDHDFKQLQIMSNVDQWSVNNKKMLRENRPDLFLREHIIRGDRGDGIPNFLSDDDCLVMKKRQKQIRSDRLEKWIEHEHPEDFDDNKVGENEIRNWYRNQKLIDLVNGFIPQYISDEVMRQYHEAHREPFSSLLNYAIKFKVRILAEEIAHF